MKLKYFYTALIALASLTACEDLDTKPGGATLTEEQKSEISDAMPSRAEAGVRSIFAQFNVYMPNETALNASRHNDFGYSSIMFFTDCNTEDMVSGDNGYNWGGNSLTFDDRPYTSRECQIVWNDYYSIIFTANAVVAANADAAKAANADAVKLFYLAQGYAARGFCYEELVQLYQFNYKGHETAPSVPLITNENATQAALDGAPRARVDSVYSRVNKDLTAAIELLTKVKELNPKFTRNDKRYIDLATAYGLRARMNLAMQNWAEAAADAEAAIKAAGSFDGSKCSPATIADVSKPSFKDASEKNWMWGIYIAETDDVVQSGIVNWISHNGTFNYGYGQYSGGHQISKKLYNSIPATDVRKGWWSNADGECNNVSDEWNAYLVSKGFAPYTNCKFAPYKDVLENDVNANDIPLMRIEEMYLILAEAQLMLGQDGKGTLERFIQTYRDPAYTCKATDIQNEIYRHKRIELWGEGRIWFDVMRLNKGIDRRGGGYEPNCVLKIAADDPVLLWPIPQKEINGNNALTEADHVSITVPTAVADADIDL